MDNPPQIFTPRFIFTILGIAIFGAISGQFFFSPTGAVLLFSLLISGIYKLGTKNPTGWILLGAYFYFNCYRNPGSGSWIMLTLSIYAVYSHIQWKKSTL